MQPTMSSTVIWTLLLSATVCLMVSGDNVLRFVSQKELDKQRAAQTDDIIIARPIAKSESALQAFRPRNTVCPDKVTECQDGTTCCPLSSGQYGCCKGVNAVCCSDGTHCCPQGYKCDEAHGQCVSTLGGILRFPWEESDRKVLRSEPKSLEVTATAGANITCPNVKTVCLQNDTCCSTVVPGSFACCPLPRAVCCQDKLHCCPAGSQCDLVRHRCFSVATGLNTPWLDRSQASDGGDVPSSANHRPSTKAETVSSSVSSSLKKVVCPGGSSECPDGSTCCQLSSGEWGCCPKPNAVCCSDRIHCCPQSYTCDDKSGSCKPPHGEVFIPWAEKQPASPRVAAKEGAVVCPNHRTQCANGQTCCLETSGDYGCCPFPEARCCRDRTHCCPSGFTCNLKQKTCERGYQTIAMAPKQPAMPKLPMNVMCPDGQSQCPDGQTCCDNGMGAYACCPSPNATCCSDHIHCCPSGYKCDLAAKTCDHGLSERFPSVPLMKKEEAITEKKPTPSVAKTICPDNKSECSDGQTCCKLSSGQYGCCPRPEAVCCSDHLHCCPKGYTCDTTAGSCNQGNLSLPWDTKEPASLH